MAKFEEDIARVFGGKDNEPITDELIKELVSSTKFEEKDLRWFQEEGYTYCRPRNSFIGSCRGKGYEIIGSFRGKGR